MNLSIERLADVDEVAYTVNVDRDRILTVVTESDLVLMKWLKEAKKRINNTKQQNKIVVSLTAETESASTPPNPNQPYNLLVMSLGSSCILYLFADQCSYIPKPTLAPKFLRDFLSDRKVMVVGVGIESVVEKLSRMHGIKVANAVDLAEMAMKHHIMDFKDLNGLATRVLGINKHIERSRKKLLWYSFYRQFTEKKVMYATAESHQIFQIASALIRNQRVTSKGETSNQD